MKLGTRITLTTTGLVMVALVIYSIVSVRIRSAELTADLEHQTQSVGQALKVALEAALQEGLYEDVRRLVARIEAGQSGIEITYLELRETPPAATAAGGDGGMAAAGGDAGVAAPAAVPANPAAGRDGVADDEESEPPPPIGPPPEDARERIRRIEIDGLPSGEHLERAGRPVYAYTVPLRDERHRIVAVIDLTRDESDINAALATTVRQVIAAVIVVGLGLALLVWLTTRSGISHPLQRLVEGIDEVTVGDLTRVILRERDDEIGDLADRFNHMTTSLREARAETERGVEAKLALEARLRHSEKLATIGQLAAQIAHEVGTPLNVIGGRARSMEKRSGDPSEVGKNAGIIAAQAARITKIIQRLLDYSRNKAVVRTPLDLQVVVKDTIDFLEHQLQNSHVTVQILPFPSAREDLRAPAEPIVLGDADQLQQVCINLFLNAIQSMMTRGGQLEIGCRGAVRRKPGLDVAPPGRYVVLEVADTGIGIPPEDRERIFEPFYSTKQDSGGTGLGLAVSQGIVKDHDGWIEIEGRQGGGTLFRVFLPIPEPGRSGTTGQHAQIRPTLNAETENEETDSHDD